MDKRLSGLSIVVVDDDEDVLDSFAAALEAEGADVEAVSDGNAGVRAVRELKPDVVVLDMMLPGRSGFLALEKIKGHQDSPLVIMVTANEGKRHQAYAESLGVDSYLQKPVPLGSLVECVESLIEKRRSEEAANS